MDRERYLVWAEQQLAFWAESGRVITPTPSSRRASLASARYLAVEANEEGLLRVELGTDDEDTRLAWSEIFRRTEAGEPPYPPGRPPDNAGRLDLLVSSSGKEVCLRFEWLCLASDYIDHLDTVMGCIAWLVRLSKLSAPDQHA